MPIFKDVSTQLDYDPKGREKLADQVSRTLSTDDAEASTDLSTSVSERIRKSIYKNTWTAKSARTARVLDRYYIGRTISPYAGAVAACMMIATKQPIDATLWFIGIAIDLFMFCNPHDIFSRWLSVQTRVVIGIDSSLIIISMLSGNPYYLVSAMFWSGLTIAICKALNKRWLFMGNMLMSEQVRTALVQCPDTNGMTRWAECGKREVRTFASEAGLPFDDQVLEIAYLGVWLCGYYSDHIESNNHKKEVEEIQAEVNKHLLDITLKQKTIDELTDKVNLLESTNNQLMDDIKSDETTVQLSMVRSENNKLKARIRELEADLVKMADITPEELLERKVMELRRKTDANGDPLSYAVISQELETRGIKVSKSKVGDICKRCA